MEMEDQATFYLRALAQTGKMSWQDDCSMWMGEVGVFAGPRAPPGQLHGVTDMAQRLTTL